MQPCPVRFGVFALDLRSGELFKNGAKVRLHEKPFQVLAALLERPGEIVMRHELRDRLWSADTFVDFDNNLNAAVRKLREALGDSADSPRFIETLPRRGYRFIAPVEPGRSGMQSEEELTAAPLLNRQSVLLLAGLLAAVVSGWIWFSRPGPVARPPDGKLLLAVMPFDNLDRDESRDYFCDGLTEELIAHLGRLQPERLGVIARLSSMTYKGADKSVEQIGRELGVQYVIEGSVRSAGDKLRVTVLLIQVFDQTHLWSETYDRRFADTLDVQRDVAQRVASSLTLELLPGEPEARARAATSVTEAYEQYLRGRHQWSLWTGDGYRAAIGHFQRAVELDPEYALAHAGLADAYNLLAFTGVDHVDAFNRARAAARKALELDPDLAEAHNSIGFVRLYLDYDPEAAESAFRRAVEINPNYAMAHHWRAGALSVLEQHDDAIESISRSLELDPVSLSVMSDLGWYYLFADRPAEALEVCERTLSFEGEYGWAKSCRFEALVRLGRIEEAVVQFLGEATQGGTPEERLAPLRSMEPDDALRIAYRMRLDHQRGDADKPGVDPVSMAMTFVAGGEHDAAMELLQRGYEQRNAWLVFLRVDPRFDALAVHSQYDDLSRRIGLTF